MHTKIIIKRRKTKNKICLSPNLNPLMNKIYITRGIKSITEINYKSKFLISFKLLHDIYKAVKLLYQAIIKNSKVIVIGDFDVDGATSTALAVIALNNMGLKNIHYLIPNRFKEGYGLTIKLVKKALILGAEFILTVDNGTSSFSAVQYAHEQGLKIIITDHHLPKNNKFPNADAIVNPNIANKNLSLTSLSGVGVIFYLMIALRSYLRKKNWFKKTVEPNLAELLDLVALGTISDLVPLNNNNRILVKQGLQRIKLGKSRIGIQVLLKTTKININNITPQDISFFISPIINAAGRMDDITIVVNLLITKDIEEAKKIVKKLKILNEKRKYIAQNMQYKAISICNELKKKNFPPIIIIFDPKWHQGIIGIISAKLKDLFYRPVITFAAIGNGILQGSGRSIQNINILKILEKIKILHPNIIIDFGGHAMACGLSIKEKNLTKFNQILIFFFKKILNQKKLKKIIWSDGKLNCCDFNISTAEMLYQGGPWGKDFPEPVFDGYFYLLKKKIINNKHLKVILKPINGGPVLFGIAFNINIDLWSNLTFKIVQLIYRMNINITKKRKSLQLIIDYIQPLNYF